MNKTDSTIAQQIARLARRFQEQRTGYGPKAVTVVLSEDTVVVTLHEALTPAEKAMSQSPEGAAQVQEYHRQFLQTRLLKCERRSRGSRAARCARRLRKSKRQRAPSCMYLRPVRWFRCFC